jgi:SSS family solute:Na+ symporter
VNQARGSLLVSAYWKIPLQALVLLVGVFLFLFYLFGPPKLIFDARTDASMRRGPRAADYAGLERRFEAAAASRSAAASVMVRAREAGDQQQFAAATREFTRQEGEARDVRNDTLALIRDTTGDRNYNDVNYVFPTFITTQLPVGLVGLLIAAILAAAMSAVGGELSAVSTASVIDFYRRFVRPADTDAHYLMVSRVATVFWGILASIVAVWAVELGSLIEVVNRFGSYFYGSILGVFILAIGFKRATANGAFVGLIAGMTAVGLAATYTNVAFLWHNVTGAVAAVAAGLLVSALDPGKPAAQRT